ncbi:MAG TPA: hypothetical protein VE573_19035 [Nitrososphaeraceae archaeon]|nr:hypothetical protein [Nitrososphaeraceae archaeon]
MTNANVARIPKVVRIIEEEEVGRTDKDGLIVILKFVSRIDII